MQDDVGEFRRWFKECCTWIAVALAIVGFILGVATWVDKTMAEKVKSSSDAVVAVEDCGLCKEYEHEPPTPLDKRYKRIRDCARKMEQDIRVVLKEDKSLADDKKKALLFLLVGLETYPTYAVKHKENPEQEETK